MTHHKLNPFLIVLFFFGCDEPTKNTEDQDAYSTANVLCDLNREVYNNDESVKATSKYAWTCDADIRSLSGNGIPDHEVGTFPNPHNPNSIRAQSVNKTFTIQPFITSETGIEVGGPRGTIAYALNSVKFDPATAGRCDDNGNCSLAQGQGRWNIEALGHNTFDFGDDMNHAHVQPTGEYHYHGIPELFMAQLDKGLAMTLVGWAADGFPIYALYGYSGTTQGIKEHKSSYRLKKGLRSSGFGHPGGKFDGSFISDYEFIEGSGDLDECNGLEAKTPEFPQGTYVYFISRKFPIVPRCFKGTPDRSFYLRLKPSEHRLMIERQPRQRRSTDCDKC